MPISTPKPEAGIDLRLSFVNRRSDGMAIRRVSCPNKVIAYEHENS
ncbi:MAG: hypothetical protein MI684_11360 [Chlorobiales bacterium]|nr:hypothetical protein [Chlorobiales bacterium]